MRQVLTALTFVLGVGCFSCLSLADALQSCGGVTGIREQAARAGADSFISKTWVDRGPDWIAAYDSKPVARNPFAVAKDVSGGAAIHGFVWARDVTCTIGSGPDAASVLVTYAAGTVRFKEGKIGWSKPLKDSVLVVLELSKTNGNWTVADKSAERSVLMPENILRHPEPAELPKPNSWPDKRCPPPKSWLGKDCVAQSSGTASK